MTEDMTDSTVELAIVILINDYIVKLPYKYLFYTHRPGLPSTLVSDVSLCSELHQCWDAHLINVVRRRDWGSVLNGSFFVNYTISLGSRSIVGEEDRKNVRTWWWKKFRRTDFRTGCGYWTHELILTVILMRPKDWIKAMQHHWLYKSGWITQPWD